MYDAKKVIEFAFNVETECELQIQRRTIDRKKFPEEELIEFLENPIGGAPKIDWDSDDDSDDEIVGIEYAIGREDERMGGKELNRWGEDDGGYNVEVRD